MSNNFNDVKSKNIMFLCSGTDFNAFQMYKTIKKIRKENINIVIDNIESEGNKRLVSESDIVHKLFIIDCLLSKKSSAFGHIWRNIIKLLVYPIQIVLLKKIDRNNPNTIFFAYSMYYLWLAWGAGVSYVGKPEGSDILIRPFKSKLYRVFAIRSLQSAKAITVDSKKLADTIYNLSGVTAYHIQDGIDTDEISNYIENYANRERKNIVSFRGLVALYQIEQIFISRNNSKDDIILIYPVFDTDYTKKIKMLAHSTDNFLGKIDKFKMYELFASTKLAISIPYSDSSPKSVYEAIFCGCAVAIVYHEYYDCLPECMKSRIIQVDIHDKEWFDKAIVQAEEIIKIPFKPSKEAIKMFIKNIACSIIIELIG
jgi:hypothetical protein